MAPPNYKLLMLWKRDYLKCVTEFKELNIVPFSKQLDIFEN